MKNDRLTVVVCLFSVVCALHAQTADPTAVKDLVVFADGSPQPRFSWTAPTAGAEVYDLKVQRHLPSGWRLYRDYTPQGGATNYSFGERLDGFANGLYRMALRARTPFWTGPWTPWMVFAIDVPRMDGSVAPVLYHPLSGSNNHRPVFAWKGVPNATRYELTIQRRESPTGEYTTNLTGFGTNGETCVTRLAWDLPEGSFRWNVTPIDGSGKRGTTSGWVRFSSTSTYGGGGGSSTIDHGDGIQMTFCGVFNGRPVIPGSVAIRGRLAPGGEDEVFIDYDKNGVLYSSSANNPVTGFVDYYSGAFSVQFLFPVMDGWPVVATYWQGTIPEPWPLPSNGVERAEVVAKGNAVQRNFAAEVNCAWIVPGSVRVSAAICPAAEIEGFIDIDGDGILYSTLGSNPEVGFINYLTGTFHVPFLFPVVNGGDVSVSYRTNSAF